MKICIAVEHNFKHDIRALKEAITLKKAGYEVIVIAQNYGKVKKKEMYKGISIIRIGDSFFLLKLLKRYINYFDNVAGYREKSKINASQNCAKEMNENNQNKSANNIVMVMWWWLIYRMQLMMALIKVKANVYHAHAPGTLFPTFIAAKLNCAKIIYDAHELHTRMDIHAHYPSLLKKTNDLMEKIFISKVNAVITVSKSIAKELQNIYGIELPLVLLNCPYYVGIERSERLRELLSISKGTRIVLYQGWTFIPNRGLEQLIDAAKYLRNAIVVLLGDGQLKQKLEHQVRIQNLKNRVKFIPPVNPHELLSYTVSADIGVNLLQNSCVNFYYAISNKLFEYMMAGIPTIASNFPEMKNIIEENAVGKVTNPEDPKKIAEAINEILDNDELRQKMSENALYAAKYKYNWEIESAKLLDLYKRYV